MYILIYLCIVNSINLILFCTIWDCFTLIISASFYLERKLRAFLWEVKCMDFNGLNIFYYCVVSYWFC